MNVEAILQTKGTRVATTRSDATIATVVHRLKLEGIGALVVSDDGKTLAGMISERDILRGFADYGPELLERRVAEVMTREVITCAPQDSVKRVMTLMTRSRVRHLPVVEDGRLCGIVSIGDVVKNRLEELELETSVLRDIYIATH